MLGPGRHITLNHFLRSRTLTPMTAPRTEISAILRQAGLAISRHFSDANITVAENTDLVFHVADSRVLSVIDQVQGGIAGISCTIQLKSLPSGDEMDPATRQHWSLHLDEAERLAGLTEVCDPASFRVCTSLLDFHRRLSALLPAMAAELRKIAQADSAVPLAERLVARVREARGLEAR